MPAFETDRNQVERIDGMTVEFPYCMHKRDLTNFVIPWHWHEELELGYIEKGTGIIRTLTQEFVIHQGDGFFINTNVVNSKLNGNKGKPALEINHIFHPFFIGGHFGSLITSKYLNPVLQNQMITVHILRRGTKEANALLDNLARLKKINEEANQEITIRNLLSETWLMLLDEIEKHSDFSRPADSEKQNQIKNMLSYIHRNYSEKISLAHIAQEALVSEREANRMFKNAVKQTPFEYLMNYRLEKVGTLLENSELSVTEISYLCGFTDSAYMGKQFRKKFGSSPGEYRKKIKSNKNS